MTAILQDADRVAPGRSHASDGTIGDPTHAASKSDHNPDFRGVVHAVDVTHDPAHGMDTWVWAQRIADRMRTGAESRVEYLVAYDPARAVDVIFHPSVSLSWRQNGSPKREHTNHLHVSIKYSEAAENDVRPFFVTISPPATAPPPPTATVVDDPEEDDPMQPTARIIYKSALNTFWIDQHGKLWQTWDSGDGPHLVNLTELLHLGVVIQERPTLAVTPAADLMVGIRGTDGIFNDLRYAAKTNTWVQHIWR